MRTIIAIVVSSALSFGFMACGGKQKPAMTEDQARQEYSQLMTLYKEARPKFVVQLQQMEQEQGCARAKAMKAIGDKIKAEADMKPEKSEEITIVTMELTEAEKKCLAKK